jgi:hypothetical protein
MAYGSISAFEVFIVRSIDDGVCSRQCKKSGKLSTAAEIGLAMIPFIVFSYFGRLFQHETQVGFWIFWVTAILVLTFTLHLVQKSRDENGSGQFIVGGLSLSRLLAPLATAGLPRYLRRQPTDPSTHTRLSAYYPKNRSYVAQR